MKIVILRQAYDELNDAVTYYEGEQAGLGLRMIDGVNKHIKWILKNPIVPLIRDGGYRRVNLKTFPYYIAYVIQMNTLWILAIAHSHRKPEYWIERMCDVG